MQAIELGETMTEVCRSCEGTGEDPTTVLRDGEPVVLRFTCSTCGGTGAQPHDASDG